MSNPRILRVHILTLFSIPFIDMPNSDSTFFSHLSPQPAMFPQISAFYNTCYRSSSILTILLHYLKPSIYPQTGKKRKRNSNTLDRLETCQAPNYLNHPFSSLRSQTTVPCFSPMLPLNYFSYTFGNSETDTLFSQV